MSPVEFKEVNAKYKAPEGLAESQVMTIPAFRGDIVGGSMDGEAMVVVAWKPDGLEISRLLAGEPVYLSVIGGLPPHFLSTSFQEATHPA